jgi:signal transduction histidine kinase
MRFNLKLSHIQVLIAIPMVCLIVLGVALATLLEQANAERRLETHSKEIVSESNDIAKHMIDVAGNVIALNVSQNPLVYNRYKESLSVTKNGIANLKQLTADDKTKRKKMKKVGELGDKALSFIENYAERAYKGETGADFGVFKKELAATYHPFITELHSLADMERKRAADAPINERQRQKKLITVLVAGLSITLVSMFFSSMYIKWIIKRLRLMMANAKLLARKEPLHSPVRGTDEIAELDGVFHEMAEALNAAEQRKQEFVSTTCHDLRSPLANIQVSLALAAKGKYGELNEKGVERFEKAEQSIDRLIQLLNELLDAEKMEAGILEIELEDMNLADAVASSLDAVRTLAENSRVTLEAVGPCEGEIIGDQARLIRVIVNLLSNAIKFSPPGTTVSVSVHDDGTRYEVRIADQGRGIAPEDRVKIFDRFHRVSENTGPSGIGLGLTICKKIIEAHGGEIGVDSTVGSGSTFWFKLCGKGPHVD